MLARSQCGRGARARRCRNGFTLVEMLVVIAIMGILVALLLPAIQAARHSARTSKCLNNLHQIGVGMALFTNIDGHFPWTYHAGAADSWIDTMAPYMENTDQVRLCPEDPMGLKRVVANASGLRGTSYVINEYVAYVTTDGNSCLNINFLKSAHTLPVLFEGANYGRTVEDDHVHASTWYAPADILQGTVLNVMIAEINPTQHVTCANYLYADGHSETVSYDTFLSWVQADIAAGWVRPAAEIYELLHLHSRGIHPFMAKSAFRLSHPIS